MLKNKGLFVLGAILIAAFSYGLIKLLLLRFESGDVYPYYSSLRADPLGVKALYESLQQCCGLSVERSYDPLTKSKQRNDSVYLDIGDRVSGVSLIPDRLVEDLEQYVQNGGRLVITFLPYRNQKELTQELMMDLFVPQDESARFVPVNLCERWGFDYFGYALSSRASNNVAHIHPGESLRKPEEISIHTVLYFSDLSSHWKVVYDRNGHAVVVERPMGKGSIVLSAESYFLSNEAMLKERHPELIAWLVGGKSQVIFDEYDHGVAYDPGVATLMRKYRLQWLVAGVLLLAALFVWKSSASLVPPYRDEEDGSRYSLFRGNDAAAGLANLLRRSVPAGSLFAVCYQEWKKSQKTKYAVKLDRIESIVKEQQQLSPRRRDPVESYNHVSRILAERK